MERTYEVKQVVRGAHLALKVVFFEDGEEVGGAVDAYCDEEWCIARGEEFVSTGRMS